MTFPLPTNGRGDILFVWYADDKPCSVITTESEYDFAWCNRDNELLFHDAGGGLHPGATIDVNPHHTFWAADCVDVRIVGDWDHDTDVYRVNVAATPDECARHNVTRVATLSDPFDDATEAYYGIEYCSICQDSFDRDSMCSHLFDGSNGIAGPGSDEGIKHLKPSFLRFCAIASITRRLRHGLVPFAIDIRSMHALGGLGSSIVNMRIDGTLIGDIAEKFRGCDDELSDAASLLFALDEKTTDANALVKQWLDDAVDMQDKRRESYERCYVVTDDDRYATSEAYAIDKYHKYLDGDAVTGTVFATRLQRHASRMSWKEASSLAKQLNGNRYRKNYFVRYLLPKKMRSMSGGL